MRCKSCYDFYARDGSRRVTTGYRQKQKTSIVITPPFGYFKDKNTNQVEIVPDAAETIHLIFTSYVGGMGLKAIAKMLNEETHKTPAQMQLALLGKRMPERLEKEIKKKYLWEGTMVSRILRDESYAGTLICHKSERNKINKTFRFTEASEQFRHEKFYPVIVDREEWEQVQAMLKANAKPYRGNTASHRYAGLLTCGDCGSTFVPRIRCWNGARRVEYLCHGYMHNGKAFCPSHRIRESELDARVQQYAEELRDHWILEEAYLRRIQRKWEMKRPMINAHIADLYDEIQRLEQEVDDLLMEIIQNGG